MSDKIGEREQFELFIAEELGHTVEYIKGQRAVSVDRYYNEFIEIPYRAWKAGRRAAEVKPVELPKKADASNLPFAAHGYNAAIDDCMKAIKAAGGTVEGG